MTAPARLKLAALGLPPVALFALLGRFDAALALLATVGYLWWELGRRGKS